MANAKISELPLLQKLGNTGAAPSASRNWDFAYTWTVGATTYVADFMNVTDTASAAGSLLIDRQVGGSSKFSVTKAGLISANGVNFLLGLAGYSITYTGSGGYAINVGGSAYYYFGGGGNFSNRSDGVISFSTTTNPDTTKACGISRKADGVIEFNTGTRGTYTGTAFGSGSQTVAQLPAAATAGKGARSFVTDASATTFLSTVAGGGANNVPVVSDGTNWLIG